jgi:predicted nucleic acid-binding protein
MNILVDTNILFSIIISPTGAIAKTIEAIKNSHKVFISDFSFDEINNHKQKLLNLSKLSESDLDKIIEFFEKDFIVITSEAFSDESILSAFELVKDVDIDDLPIVASVLSTKSILFTGDKKLYTVLKQKNFNSVYNNEELRELLQL